MRSSAGFLIHWEGADLEKQLLTLFYAIDLREIRPPGENKTEGQTAICSLSPT